jgi:hypothetical protein
MDIFLERPILNSPYAYPDRHWELDDDGQPTNKIVESRRCFITLPQRDDSGREAWMAAFVNAKS